MVRKILYAALLSTSLSSFSYADTKGPIQAVTLSTGGLAEIHRTASIEDDGKVLIEVPLDQVDDILKSLIVRDAEGTVKGISLAGPQPVEETFRTLPFAAADLQSLPQLLASLQGTRVTVATAGKSLEGKILGVTAKAAKNGSQHVLSLLTSTGKIASTPLTDTTEVTIKDPDIQAKIETAVEAVGKGKSDGSRVITIEMGGRGNRDIGISYVVSAPVWKTAYRLVVDNDKKARIQSWAVLENATGEDWEGVDITLASGSPVTLKQALHQRIWKDRTEIGGQGAAGDDPRTTNRRGLVMGAPAIGAMAMRADQLSYSDAASGYIPEMARAETAETSESDVVTSFSLPGTHNLTNGDTLSVPIVDEDIDAELVALYALHQNSEHPVAAVMFKNTTGAGMPPGIITVYDKTEGYIGDARMPNLAPGEKQFARFATDKKVTVRSDVRSGRVLKSIQVVDGLIRTRAVMENQTTYSISTTQDADRTIIIEHPKTSGWTLKTDHDFTENEGRYQIKVALSAGARTTVNVVEERSLGESYTIADIDTSMISQWVNDTHDESMKEKLKELGRLKAQQHQARWRADDLKRQVDELSRHQNRIRQNLSAVPSTSDMHQKLLESLEASEAKLQSLEAEVEESIQLINRWKSKVDEVVRTF